MITINDVKRKNKEIGHNFFSEDTMRFFNSRIETKGNLIGDKFFITSEQFVPSTGVADDRKFTIREFDNKTGMIDTIGDFNKHSSLSSAKAFANCMADKNDLNACEVKK